jgi:SAM-dependent methyltransferase
MPTNVRNWAAMNGWAFVDDRKRFQGQVVYKDFECAFAAAAFKHLGRASQKRKILDVGSYRQFVIGLSMLHDVHSVDLNHPEGQWPMKCHRLDVLDLDLVHGYGTFDAVLSLSAIEHFGLGRYGDSIDMIADKLAIRCLADALKPGGTLVISTTITGGRRTLAFNAHKIYDMVAISELRDLAGLEVESEALFSRKLGRRCSASELTPGGVDPETGWSLWDVYCGCWTKP